MEIPKSISIKGTRLVPDFTFGDRVLYAFDTAKGGCFLKNSDGWYLHEWVETELTIDEIRDKIIPILERLNKDFI